MRRARWMDALSGYIVCGTHRKEIDSLREKEVVQ